MVSRSIPAASHRPSRNLDQGRRSKLGHQVSAGNRSLAPTQRLHTGDEKSEWDCKLEWWGLCTATRDYPEARPFSGSQHTSRARHTRCAKLPFTFACLREWEKRAEARYFVGSGKVRAVDLTGRRSLGAIIALEQIKVSYVSEPKKCNKPLDNQCYDNL